MSIRSQFTRHPASVGETYGEHFLAAMGFSLRMLQGAFCCALHAVFPFLCERTASAAICELHERMVTKRSRVKEGHSAEVAG